MDYIQAITLGLIQGVTELFPVSSLGHSVILPKLLGWDNVVAAQSAKESFFLAFLVGLHVATALALLTFYWRDWIRVIRDVVGSVRMRRIETADARLGWLIIVATIPAGLMGVLFEHAFRTIFAKPLLAAGFLFVNGLILLAGEWFRRRAEVRSVAVAHGLNAEGARRLDPALRLRPLVSCRPGRHARLPREEGINPGASGLVRHYPGRDLTVVMLSNLERGVWDPIGVAHEMVVEGAVD